MTRVAALAALLPVLLAAPGAQEQAQAQAAGPPDLPAVSRLVVEQTNALRRAEGLQATHHDATLADAARGFAQYMARTDRYGHEADGRTPAQRAKAQGYAYCLVSENIAYQYSSTGFGTRELAQRFVEGWKNSPPHRHNMLEPAVTETAVAIARSPATGRYYAVQMFGRPDRLRISFRIANRSPTELRYVLGGERYRLPPRVTRTHEQCRAEVLQVRLPGSERPVRVEPRDGDRFSIVREGGRYRLAGG